MNRVQHPTSSDDDDDDTSNAQSVLAGMLQERASTGHGTAESILPDLHTHLMGMGDFEFWKWIMLTVIPKYVVCRNHRWIEHLEDKSAACYSKLDELIVLLRQKEKPQFDKDRRSFASANVHGTDCSFTRDVVYNVATLCDAFGVTSENVLEVLRKPEGQMTDEDYGIMKRAVLTKLTTRRGINAGLQFKWYLVFNARKQKCEYRYGLTNTTLMKKFNWTRNNDLFIQMFEMAGFGHAHSAPTSSAIRQAYQQRFTREFYPRRYCMKDDMYSQYPTVLDILIRTQLDKYAKAGVNYVEFSVGFGDLVTRPWIFTHLSSPAGKLPVPVPRIPASIDFYYLAGFGRAVSEYVKVDFSKPQDAVEKQAYQLASATSSALFQKHLDDLNRLKQEFGKSRKCSTTGVPTLHQKCVGLDYFGDEHEFPHCSFALKKFTDFLFYERDERDGHFGFRIHAGELCQYHNDWAFKLHMGVVSINIITILTAYKAHCNGQPQSSRGGKVPLIRIGHGIGFDMFLDEGPVPLVDDGTYTHGQLLASKIPLALQMMKENKIPIEVCLTSNSVLQATEQAGDAERASGVFNLDFTQRCLERNHRVIMCTDNDGIWPIKYSSSQKEYLSVPAELFRAVAGANPDTALEVHEVAKLLSNYVHANFGVYHANSLGSSLVLVAYACFIPLPSTSQPARLMI